MGVRFRARLEAAWARECRGSRVGTGLARDTLPLEGLKVRVGEDDISEGRHLCKRHIVCFWGWKAVQAWDVGWAGDVTPEEDEGGWECLSVWPSDYRCWHGPVPGCSLTVRSPSSSPGLFSLEESLMFFPAPVTGCTEEIRLETVAATPYGKNAPRRI